MIDAPNLSTLTRLQRRRLSWRVAQGALLQKAAERAGLKGDDAGALLACPDFGRMVEDYRALVRLPTEERMRRLVEAAIVTGASRGIGKAIAMTFVENGASVVVHRTNAALLGEVCGQIDEVGGQAAEITGHVADQSIAEAAVALARDRFGKIANLVNNAGITTRSSTLDMRIEDWKRVLDVNLNGTLYFCRAVLPAMIAAKGGRIVNVSSTAGKKPRTRTPCRHTVHRRPP